MLYLSFSFQKDRFNNFRFHLKRSFSFFIVFKIIVFILKRLLFQFWKLFLFKLSFSGMIVLKTIDSFILLKNYHNLVSSFSKTIVFKMIVLSCRIYCTQNTSVISVIFLSSPLVKQMNWNFVLKDTKMEELEEQVYEQKVSLI